MSILFLDFDGPLFSDRAIRWIPQDSTMLQYLKDFATEEGDTFGSSLLSHSTMDATSVAMINTLARDKNLRVVLSTSWRMYFSVAFLKRLMELNGLFVTLHPEHPITPLLGESRAYEIAAWLRKYHNGVEPYGILDDRMSGSGLYAAYEGFELDKSLQAERIILVDCESGTSTNDFLDLETALSTDSSLG